MDDNRLVPSFLAASDPYRDYRNVPTASRRIPLIRAPGDVYDSFLRLYLLSTRLAERMAATLDDGEHLLLMREGREMNFALPDDLSFRDEIEAYQEFLRGFNPFHVRHLPCGKVEMPTHTARSFVHMAHYTGRIVEQTLQGVFKTEYLHWIRALKNLGAAYAGPCALQETVDAFSGLWAAHRKTQTHIAHGTIRKDWPSYVF